MYDVLNEDGEREEPKFNFHKMSTEQILKVNREKVDSEDSSECDDDGLYL